MKPAALARSLIAATGLFAAGWVGGSAQHAGGVLAPVPSAIAQEPRTRMDPNLLAIAMGLASVAVDTEATALKLNDLTDRLAALEQRVQQFETRPR